MNLTEIKIEEISPGGNFSKGGILVTNTFVMFPGLKYKSLVFIPDHNNRKEVFCFG